MIRKNKNGFDRIIFNTYDSYPISHQELSIGFQKRINNVEEVVNQFYNERFKNPEFDKFSITIHSDYELLKELYNISFKSEDEIKCMICNEIENLKEDGFILHTEKDINLICNYLITFIQDKVLLFFEINDDINYVNNFKRDKILNSSEIFSHPLELMRSLTLMKLTSDPYFDTSKELYLKKAINPHDDFGTNKLEIQTIKELINYLEKIKN